MQHKIKSILIIAIVSLFFSANSQDSHYSQFYANPLYLNPAFAGSKICPRLIMNYRNQWPAIPGSYVTYNASFDMHFDALQGGLGVLVNSDRAGEGVLTTQSASLIYSVLIPVTREFALKFGMQGGYFQKSLDYNRLYWGDQITPWGFTQSTMQPGPSTGNYYRVADVDFAAGFLGYSEKFYFGFAAHHIVPVDQAFGSGVESILPMKMTGHIGGIIPLERTGRRGLRDDAMQLSPNLVYIQQGPFHQFNGGMYFKKQPMIFGLWYRRFFEGSDAIVVLAGFEYDKFKFGYSYDITLSQLASASGGAHEFSMALEFNCPRKKQKIRQINCPSF